MDQSWTAPCGAAGGAWSLVANQGKEWVSKQVLQALQLENAKERTGAGGKKISKPERRGSRSGRHAAGAAVPAARPAEKRQARVSGRRSPLEVTATTGGSRRL
ncbi:hypothetical protein NDU88_001979 [Pleurodeles waltl]|uniref:Uncharacterized protein n=1 Tax=Pleurodeles waltl TaxID=8319 RepID=A0AAV7RBY2_PLEWA|nr:hypothetical protein NDU88_001979 [Pleurodeles waltl]